MLVAIEESELELNQAEESQAEGSQSASSASRNNRAHSCDEEERFVTVLQEIADVFQNNVNKNEATSRNFINPFLIRGIKKVQSQYPEMFLSVEEEFGGTRGYGKLDYAVWYIAYAILVTVAKFNAIDAGITQNLAQLYTASEVSNLVPYNFTVLFTVSLICFQLYSIRKARISHLVYDLRDRHHWDSMGFYTLERSC